MQVLEASTPRPEGHFEPEGDGTRIIQEFQPDGLVATIAARIFSIGSYHGSFEGELNAFARLAESETTGSGSRASDCCGLPRGRVPTLDSIVSGNILR